MATRTRNLKVQKSSNDISSQNHFDDLSLEVIVNGNYSDDGIFNLPELKKHSQNDLLGLLSPENLALYKTVALRNFSLPDISGDIEEIEEKAQVRYKIEALNNKIKDFYEKGRENNKALAKTRGLTLKEMIQGFATKYVAFLFGSHEEFQAEVKEKIRYEKKEFVEKINANRAEFNAKIYNEINKEIGPLMNNYVAKIQERLKYKVGIITHAEKYVAQLEENLNEAFTKREELKEKSYKHKENALTVKEEIQVIDNLREQYVAELQNFIRVDIPSAYKDVGELAKDYAWCVKFNQVAPDILLELQDNIKSGKVDVGNIIKGQGNELLRSLSNLNNQTRTSQEPLDSSHGVDPYLIELESLSEVLNITNSYKGEDG